MSATGGAPLLVLGVSALIVIAGATVSRSCGPAKPPPTPMVSPSQPPLQSGVHPASPP